MSDTPRTDAVVKYERLMTSPTQPCFRETRIVDADFARTLERELAAVTRERDALKIGKHFICDEDGSCTCIVCESSSPCPAVDAERNDCNDLRAEVERLKALLRECRYHIPSDATEINLKLRAALGEGER